MSSMEHGGVEVKSWKYRIAFHRSTDLPGLEAGREIWWALKDLNLRPTDYESAALTAELRAQVHKL